jgi:hypothetical protein
MAKQGELMNGFDPEAVVFDLGRLRAREMSIISKIGVTNPQNAWDDWALIFARVVVSAPGLEGDIADGEAWLDGLLKDQFEKLVQRVRAEISGKN